MATVKGHVKEYYAYTQWASMTNATATGTVGQDVVRTQHGTLTWITNHKRIAIANANVQLQTHVTVGFGRI